jgi:hypothetical protein
MIELLRDSIWTFVGAILAFTAIVVAVVIYYNQKQKKRILVEVITSVPLIRGGGAIDGLEIKFKGEIVDSAIISIFKISNIGNTPIPATDYESPIEIKYEDGTKALSANVISSSPENIPANITHNENSARVTPHLLNQGDSVIYRVLLTGVDGSFRVIGRVAGVKHIERQKPILTIVSVVLIAVSYHLSPSPHSESPTAVRAEEIPYIFSMIVGLIIFMLSSIGELKDKIQANIVRRRLLSIKSK